MAYASQIKLGKNAFIMYLENVIDWETILLLYKLLI